MRELVKRASVAAFYVGILLLAVTAGWITRKGLNARESEGRYMHQALQLVAIDRMQQTEFQALQTEAEYDQAAVSQAQQAVQRYSSAVTYDQDQAVRNELRAESMSLAAQQDLTKAAQMWDRYNQTDAQRLELLQVIEQEQVKEQQVVKQMRNMQVNQWLCAWRGIDQLCTILGGLVDLEKEAEVEDVQFHQDLQRMSEMKHEEYLEKYVAETLTGQATQYQHTAEALRQTATSWSQQAAKDHELATSWNYTAQALRDEVARLHDRERSYLESKTRMSNTMHDLLKSAKAAEISSRKYFVLGLILAAAPFGFFLFRVVQVGVTMAFDFAMWTKNAKKIQIFKATMYCGLHVLLFLVASQWCRDYVSHLDQYSVEKRAVVVFYFSSIAAFLQTLALHFVPQVLAVMSDLSDIWVFRPMAKYFILRTLLLVPLFAMELLMVWLGPYRVVVLGTNTTKSVLIHLLLTGVLAEYYILQMGESAPQDCDDSSTVVWTGEDDDSETERTPLKASLTETDAMPQLYMSGLQAHHLEVEGNMRLGSSSPYHIDLKNELSRLVLVFEAFMVFCTLLIMDICYSSLLGKSYVFMCRILLLVVFVWAMLSARSAIVPSSPDDDGQPKTIYV